MSSAVAIDREQGPQVDLVQELERRFVAKLLLDPAAVSAVAEIVRVSDFADARAAKILEAIFRLSRAGSESTLSAVGDELHR